MKPNLTAGLASLALPGAGHALASRPLSALSSLLACAAAWTLVMTSHGPLRLVALLCALCVHLASGYAAAHFTPDAPRSVQCLRQQQASAAAALALSVSVLAAVGAAVMSLGGWDVAGKQLPYLLTGPLRAEENGAARWRLWGLLPLVTAPTALVLGVRFTRSAPGALAASVLLALGVALLWPLLWPQPIVGGLALSVILTVLALTLALPLGVLAAIMRVSTLGAVSTIARLYIDLTRAVPLMVWIFAGYLLLPYALGQGTGLLSVILMLAAFTAAYFAEAIRAGLQDLPRGQDEAARAIGLSGTQTMLLITLPQAMRRMLPTLIAQAVTLFKDTSLVAVVSMLDLTTAARSIANRLPDASFALYLTAAACYFAVSFLLARAGNALADPQTRKGQTT